jgi:hypothetical protein
VLLLLLLRRGQSLDLPSLLLLLLVVKLRVCCIVFAWCAGNCCCCCWVWSDFVDAASAADGFVCERACMVLKLLVPTAGASRDSLSFM